MPGCLDDFIDESNPVRAIDVFVDALDLAGMSFEGLTTGARWNTTGDGGLMSRRQTRPSSNGMRTRRY